MNTGILHYYFSRLFLTFFQFLLDIEICFGQMLYGQTNLALLLSKIKMWWIKQPIYDVNTTLPYKYRSQFHLISHHKRHYHYKHYWSLLDKLWKKYETVNMKYSWEHKAQKCTYYETNYKWSGNIKWIISEIRTDTQSTDPFLLFIP